LKHSPVFFLREYKPIETKVTEEYCLAITQAAAGRSWLRLTRFQCAGVLGLKWTHFYTHL